jgi:hypothetical protein
MIAVLLAAALAIAASVSGGAPPGTPTVAPNSVSGGDPVGFVGGNPTAEAIPGGLSA